MPWVKRSEFSEGQEANTEFSLSKAFFSSYFFTLLKWGTGSALGAASN